MSAEALQKFRTKFPGYDDMPDRELASKVLAKHPEYQDILGDIANPAPIADNSVLGNVKKFGQGAMEGATLETSTINDSGDITPAPPEPTSAPGSMMLSNGQAKPSFMEKYFTPNAKNYGRAVGGIIPMVASELLAGAPAEALALKYGMGPVQQAMNAAGMTMASYEGLRGAAQAKPPLETAGNMAAGYISGVPLGAASYGAGKAIDFMTKDVPEGIANEYLNTPAKIADSLKQKGKPSLGSKLLNETNYGGGMSKDAVYGDINGQLEDNRMLIRNKLQQADEVAQSGSQFSGREPIYKFSNRQGIEQGTPVVNTYERGALGEPVRTKSETETLGFRYKRGGAYAGNPPIEQPPGTYEPGALGEPTRISGLPTGPGGGINLDEVRAAAGPLAAEQGNIGKSAASNSIDALIGNVASGKRVVSNEEAFDLLTQLDAEVNKAYSAVDPNTVPPDTEARAAMANKLRDLLRKNVPGLDPLLSQNHTLQLAETSLLPQVSGRPPISRGGGWLKPAITGAIGSRAGLGVARGLGSLGTEGTVPNTILESGIKPVADVSSKIGLADYIDRRSSNGRKR